MELEYYKSILVVIIASGVSLLIAYLYSKRKNHLPSWGKLIAYLIIIFPYMLVVGLRGAYVGADTITYINMFFHYDKVQYGERLFRFLLYITNKLGNGQNYSILFIIYAFFTLYIMIYAVDFYEKEEKNLTFFLFLYYCFFGANMMDQMRQLAAMSVVLLTLVLYVNKKTVWSILVGVISVGVHTSAIVVFITLLLIKCGKLYKKVLVKYYNKSMLIRYRLLFVIIFLIVILMSAYEIIIPFLASVVPTAYKQYFTTRVNIQSIGLGALFDILPVFVVLFTYKKNQNINEEDDMLYCFSIMAIPFRLIGFMSFFVARISYYPVLTSIYILSNKDKDNIWKYVLGILAILYFIIYYVFMNSHAIFPYYSIIN